MSYIYLIIISSIILNVQTKVCKSVDVRNTPSHISKFSDCRVIDGFLQIVLMEKPDEVNEYANISFAELHEITDYLIIYRVLGLTSLDIIFPKLVNIKGNKLFFGHALVIYELPNLEEIGLKTLRRIERGNIKISNCPNLCYVNTINWTAMGVSNISYSETSDCSDQVCPYECQGFCWNTYTCQNTTITKCDSSCIGCTQDNSPKHCIQCKFFNNSGTCVRACPEKLFVDNYSGRCLEQKDCLSKPGSWTIYQNLCVPKCPKGATRNSAETCVYLDNKVCNGTKIINHFELEQLVNCTHINGSLEISISGSVSTEDLHRCLGKIVSISEYLKITRSHELTTLRFFQKLRTIKGEQLWSKYYALYVVKNQNLQELWNLDRNFKMSIKSGTVIFQDNPHLCNFYVEKFLNSTRIASKDEPYKFSNGYQTACNIKNLHFTFDAINSTNITLSWEINNKSEILGLDTVNSKNITSKGQKNNKTKIVGFTIYYTPMMDDRNVLKLKDGYADTDGLMTIDSWSSLFVRSNKNVTVKKMYPFTRYGFYIKTHFLNNSENEQTPIYYFHTIPGDPSEPIDFEAKAKSDTMTELTWRSPIYINGDLSHYKLAIYLEKDYLPLIRQRDYCRHPFIEDTCTCKKKEIIRLFLNKTTCIGEDEDHYCNNKTVYSIIDPSEYEEHFKIQKRSIPDFQEFNPIILNSTITNFLEFTINATQDEMTIPVYGLDHFTRYAFFLRACNSKIFENESEHCGGREMASQRTLKRRTADAITFLGLSVKKNEVTVSWTKPEAPNSVLLAYNLEYKKINSKTANLICITSERFDNQSFEILTVGSGKYSIRVRAVSLAGYGDYTKWSYFEIFEKKTKTDSKTRAEIDWGTPVLIFLGIVALLVLGFVIYRRYKLAQNLESDRLMLENRNIGLDDEWTLDQETVEIVKELERNSIGMLYRKKSG